VYRVASGSTHGLADTAAFVQTLGGSGRRRGVGEFFAAGRPVVVARAPGRLDLMGGIADYSGSLVLELPIASATHAAVQLQESEAIEIVSLAADPAGEPRRFATTLAELAELDDYGEARARFGRDPDDHWASYVAGAFLALARERGRVFRLGARILIDSAVPEGKGVSSSASLEVAAMQAVAGAYGIDASPREIAFLCQRVENLVAGAPCGVMDQMTAACGERDRLLVLLCQPGELRGTVAVPPDLAVWGIDSGIRHSVGGADYGTVRTAAFMGYRMIADMAGLTWRESGVGGRVAIDDPRWRGYLANVAPEEFEGSYASQLPDFVSGEEFLDRYSGTTDAVTSVSADRAYPVLQATRHPIREHDRVTRFAAILGEPGSDDRAVRLGELMYQSHESYSACGLGSSGTDALVALVREAGPGAGLFGAKITGGGSGGTVAVLGRHDAAAAVEAVARSYAERTGLDPLVISGSSPGAGAFGHLSLVREE
jgi:galactokinase